MHDELHLLNWFISSIIFVVNVSIINYFEE